MDFQKQTKSFFIDAYKTAINEASPAESIKKNMRLNEKMISLGSDQLLLSEIDKIWIVGFGKASAAMAVVVEEILGDLIHEGIVITKYGHSVPLKKIKLFEAAHPIPDEQGVKATSEMISLLEKTSANDLVIALISGGGSALMVHPRQGITLDDKQKIADFLLRKGVPIEKMNTVRKHLSSVKGGQLARLALPARVVSFIISDVIGDKLESIASGATAPDPSSFIEAERILHDFSIWNKLTPNFQNWFREESKNPDAETPKPGNQLFEKVKNIIVANNQKALETVKNLAQEFGYNPLVLSCSVQGEAKEIARFYGAIAKEIRQNNQPVSLPACVIAGGETTVNVLGTGKGGRNTEMVLAILNDLQNLGDVAFFSVGTDGNDGPTDAAGAFAFSDSRVRAERSGLDCTEYLKNNDSYSFFAKLDDLFCPGPSGTNVNDIQILLVQ